MKRFGSKLAVVAATAMGIFLAGFPGGPAAAAGPEVLAEVDGEAITTADLESALIGMEAVRGAPGSMDITPQAILTRLIQNRLLEQEGYRIGADRKSEVQGQFQDFVQHKSMMALLDSVSAGVPELTDEELDEFLGPPGTMNRISHILVSSPVTAHALLDSLADGASFAALAERHSLDTMFAGEGGDLGWSGQGTLIPQFEGAIEGLAVGQVGGPVQSEKGWHLIQLTDTRTERLGKSDKMRTAVYDAEMKNRVMTQMRDYVASLKKKHGVVVDEDLLKSLDYGSTDKSVQDGLSENQAVLATLGKRPFTVGGLTFKIRFQNFHGIEGKADADQIRDTVFDEWLTESLLRYEAMREGFQHKPDIAAAAESYKRDLIREAVLSLVLETPYEPEAEDMADYYAAHLEEFTPKPKVKADGVFLGDRAAAAEFKQKLEAGTSMSWLADRTPAVTDPKPDVFADWLGPNVLGGLGLDLQKGMVVGPFVIRESWAVAKIVDIEAVRPTPLAQCEKQVATSMKNARMRESVHHALEQLEAQADIRVASGAEKLISSRVDEWLAN